MNRCDCELNVRVEQLLSQLTLAEKVSLAYGVDGKHLNGVPRLGIPSIAVLDGPNGLRISYHSLKESKTTTALPCGMACAAAFSPEVAEMMGRAFALDCRARGISVILGPGVNLMRSPLGGRNFEYMGEDPFLAGKISAGVVRGCQKLHVAACLKHLALNNQEICRTNGSSDADERTVRELYMAGFEIAVKESAPWVIMSSYNRFQGQFVSECGFLQNELPRTEWGFDGVMISDWGGGNDTVGCALGGLDVGMPPEANPYSGHLLAAVQNGAVPEKVVEEKARRVLRLILRTTENLPPCGVVSIGDEEQQKIARQIAEKSMVLLKNEGGFLPLDPQKTKRIAVIGPNAALRQHRGVLMTRGGSGALFTEREVTPLAGLRKFAEKHGIRLDYYPLGKFSFDRGIDGALLGGDGLLCEIYASQSDFEAGNCPLCSRKTDGIHLPWPSHQEPPAESDWFPAALKDDPLFYRMKCRIGKTEKIPASLCILGWEGSLTVKADGVTVHEGKSASVVRFDLPFAATCQEKEIEVLFRADCANLAGVELNWIPEEKEAVDRMLKELPYADAVIYVGGNHHLHDREGIGMGNVQGADLPDLELPENQNEMISRIAVANPRTVVALFGGTPLNVETWIEKIPALWALWYPGEAGGDAFASLLFGETDPSARLPFSWAKQLEDYAPHSLNAYPGDRLSAIPHVPYKEGLLTGYRWLERKEISPRFAFGSGLSYATFSQKLLRVELLCADAEMPHAVVHVEIVNTGKRAGTQVVQLYLGSPLAQSDETRPLRELRGFEKVFLTPGERAEVAFSLTWRDFAHWHGEDKRWKVVPGQYPVEISLSAEKKDVFGSAIVEIHSAAAPVWGHFDTNAMVAN